MRHLWVRCLCAFQSILLCTLATQQPHKAIIVDTDIFSDVDDVGALAVANALHNCGYADLRAVMINTGSRYGALAASVRYDHVTPRFEDSGYEERQSDP